MVTSQFARPSTPPSCPLPSQGWQLKALTRRVEVLFGLYITWGGGNDSYFEYLIKYTQLTNTNDETFASTWKAAIESTIENLLSCVLFIFYSPWVVIDK